MKQKNWNKAGFSLVEVALALGVASVCLGSIMTLLPVGLNNCQNASSQTGATSLMTAILTDLNNTAVTGTSGQQQLSPQFGIDRSSTGATLLYFDSVGNFASDIGSLQFPKYRVSVSAVAGTTSLERFVITWPAQAQLSNIEGSVETVVAIDRN